MSRPDNEHHSIFPTGNPFKRIFPNSSYLPPSLLTLLNAFEENLAARFERLKPDVCSEVCTMTWMRSAMESLCETHHDIKALTNNLQLPVSEWDAEWIDTYLDDSVKLLDICVAFASELSHFDQGLLFLRVAVISLKFQNDSSPSQQQLVEAFMSLHDWVRHNNMRCPKLTYSYSIIRGLATSLCPAKVKHSAKGKVLMRAMYGVKVHTVFVISVFAALLLSTDSILTDMHMSDKFFWTKTFKELSDEVYGEVCDAVSCKHQSSVVTLKELETAYVYVQKPLKLIGEFGVDTSKLPETGKAAFCHSDESHFAMPQKGGNIDQEKMAALQRLAMDLGVNTEQFECTLDHLSNQLRVFFQVVLSGRDALLCNLRAPLEGQGAESFLG